MDNKNAKTGAVRSSDVDSLSYTSLPMLGLIGVARTAGEGAAKYGRMNYKRGMPVYQYLDHAFHHMLLDQNGDRSQPNLEHAAWGLLAAIESRLLHPELNAPHDLGPGATVTPEMLRHMDEQAPIHAAFRKSGLSADAGKWKLADLDDVRSLLGDRALQSLLTQEFAPPIYDAGLDADLVEEMANFLANGEEPIAYDPIVLAFVRPADRLEVPSLIEAVGSFENLEKLTDELVDIHIKSQVDAAAVGRAEMAVLERMFEDRTTDAENKHLDGKLGVALGLTPDEAAISDGWLRNHRSLRELHEARKAKERVELVQAACDHSCESGLACKFPSFCRGGDSLEVDRRMADGWNLNAERETPKDTPYR